MADLQAELARFEAELAGATGLVSMLSHNSNLVSQSSNPSSLKEAKLLKGPRHRTVVSPHPAWPRLSLHQVGLSRDRRFTQPHSP